MKTYTLTSDASGKRLTDDAGNVIITWGKGDSQESSLEASGSISLTYEECLQNYGISFLKSENPAEAEKMEKTLKTKNDDFAKDFSSRQKSQNEIIAENLKSGLWTRLGMRLVVTETGEKVCF